MRRAGILCLVLLGVVQPGLAADVAYLNLACNSDVTVTESIGLEADSSLAYGRDVSCYYHVTVPNGMQVLAFFNRFELESAVGGTCVDWVDLHDGSSVAAATLNSSPLCGIRYPFNYTSSSTDITLYFQTDSAGTRDGFFVMFTAILTPPCTSSHFLCDSGVCIDSDLRCDNFDQCGDNSDENGCPSSSAPGVPWDPHTVLIVGLTVGLGLGLVLLAAVGVVLWRYNRWRCFLTQKVDNPRLTDNPTTYSNSYPVTKFYYKDKYQHYYKSIDKPYGEEWRNDRQLVIRELSPHASERPKIHHQTEPIS